MNEFTIDSLEYNFRIKKLNAIEALALRSQIDFSSTSSVEALYYQILEKIEVHVANQWLPVKEAGKNIFYPADIENDIVAVQELIKYFINEYLMPLFMKSSASTPTQEQVMLDAQL